MHREDGEARAVEGEVADAAALVEGAVGVEDAAREENGPRDVEHEAAHAERVREDDDGAEDAAGDEHWVLGVQAGGNQTRQCQPSAAPPRAALLISLTVPRHDQNLVPDEVRLAPGHAGLGRVEDAARDAERPALRKDPAAEDEGGDLRVPADPDVGEDRGGVDGDAAARHGERAAALDVGDGPLEDDERPRDDGAGLAWFVVDCR